MSQGTEMPRRVHASNRSPRVAGATIVCGDARLGADCADVRAKDPGIGLTDVSSLNSTVGADEEGRRQTAYPVSIAHPAVTVEQDVGCDLESGHERGRRLTVVALVDEQDDQPGILRGGALDERHLAPAGCAVGRPKVDQHRPPAI